MKGRRSHLKAMKDLTAGEDRNDNVHRGTQQTGSPNYIWHLTACPVYSAADTHSVSAIKWETTILMESDASL